LKDLNIPKHLAIVMDGNNRWAKRSFLPKVAGHKKGAEAAKNTIKLCKKYGVEYLTLYTFSSENWNRPEDEVSDLMNILRNYLKNDLKELIAEGVRVRFIGRKERLDADIIKLIDDAENESLSNEFNLLIALSYSGRDELEDAAMAMVESARKGMQVKREDLKNHLYAADVPDPDLLIRTGGELRISNFLIWQIAYAELYFTETFWPDFSENELLKAFAEFSKRDRRFGR
jgi:undecaprenyl diphosphate synthase